MRITELKLENFRGFEQLEMDVHPNLTVLVGVNGSGKTTILEAIANLIGNAINQGRHIERNEIRTGADKAHISLSFENGANEGLSAVRDGEAVQDKGNRYNLDVFNAQNGPIPVLTYFRVDRHAKDLTPGSTNPSVWKPADAWNSIHGNDGNFAGFFQWFREREDLENEQFKDEPNYTDLQLTAVRLALQKLLPGYTNPKVRRRWIGSGENKTSVSQPVLAITKGDEELAFNQFSEGERTMAALTCDIARRLSIANPNSTKPLEGEGIVLIDEIDLHLHPAWQREAIPALQKTFPNIQFIIATHSPLVLGHVRNECIRVLQNFEVFEAPKTLGRDPNSLYLEIFGVPLREDHTQSRIEKISNLIDQDKLGDARAELASLGKLLGEEDSEYIHLNTLLAMLED